MSACVLAFSNCEAKRKSSLSGFYLRYIFRILFTLRPAFTSIYIVYRNNKLPPVAGNESGHRHEVTDNNFSVCNIVGNWQNTLSLRPVSLQATVSGQFPTQSYQGHDVTDNKVMGVASTTTAKPAASPPVMSQNMSPSDVIFYYITDV